MKASVVIIEDYEPLLNSYTNIINKSNNFNVVGSFTNGEDGINFFKMNTAEILLVDIQLPGINGIETIQKIKSECSTIQPIVISVHEGSKYIFDALCAGAIGYLTKNTSPEELVNAINQAKQGGAPMSTKIARKVVDSFKTPNEENLSNRENEVLTLLAKGKSYALIAEELFLSVNTIKSHARNIYEKLQVNSREDIIKRYS